MIFSFICGAFFAVMVNKGRACQVEITRGQVIAVYTGYAE